jgi:ATP/maltotriose-dependent transcriptional regulator MalT
MSRGARRGLVPRPRLSERLDRGAASKLVLVSAPAGFGKTTLLTEWLAAGPAGQRAAAWLSLDRGDNDPVSFWTYVIAALRTAAPGVGEGALALLQASRPPPVQTVLTVLLNELRGAAADIVLVLDDYHVIDASDVQDAMAFLLDHLPPQLHVVIASRTDPALPLARWRARGELAEIRAAGLRFTPDEAAAYLNEMMGLQLTARDVAALEGRTEGWIAALQLEALDRGNLFLVPLDDRRRWYRYHHLFADVLQARLLDEQPGQVPGLHRRASAWYQQNGEPSVAIGHALAAEDFGRAADLIELAIPAMRRTRQEATVRGWLEAIPDEVVRVRPVLSVAFAGALLAVGELMGVESRLRDEMVVADEEEFRRLPAMIEVYRAYLALARSDVPGTVRHARRALDLAPEEDHLCRASAAGFLGLASWTSGDLEAGHSAYAECMAGLQRAGYIADIFGCSITLADIRSAQGRLGEAMRTYERALQRVPEQGGPVLRGTADMYVGMSEVDRERDNLHAATRHLRTSQELGEHTGLPQNQYRWRVAIARIRQAEGDLAGALELLSEAERLYTGDMFPDVRPVPALKARVRIAQGSLGQALGWAREQGLSVDDDMQAAAKQGTARNYARRLLAAAGQTGHDSPVRQALTEPLSERELDVLRLLGTDLDGPDIARELTVSLNTVRTHTKHIYAKLAVTSRRAAIRRAAELGLLPRTRHRQP